MEARQGLVILSASFDRSHEQWPEIRPENPVPTFVVFGRSNVGKSTFIGRMLGRPKLVRASRTPGRTIELLRFQSTWRTGEDVEAQKKHHIYIIDTPGYGYAQRSKKEIEKCSRMLSDVSLHPPAAGVAVFLWDIRRKPKEEDLGLVRDLSETWPHLQVILTKSDKLNKSGRQKARRDLAQLFESPVVMSGEGHAASSQAILALAKRLEEVV